MAGFTLPRLEITEPIVDDKRRPTKRYQKQWADFAAAIELQVGGIQQALDEVAEAQLQIELLQLNQANFNDVIAELVITTLNQIADLQSQINTINSRLTAAGIP